MTKATKKRTPLTKRLKIIICLSVVILVAIGIGVKAWYIDAFNQTRHLAGMTAVRELVIQSARQTKADAVRDAKSGDIYFPEAKLFLPNQNVGRLTYNVSPGEDTTDISVSNEAVFNQMATKLYNTSNMEEMFKQLPHLQACQRGIKVMHAPMDTAELSANDLTGTIKLNNGGSLYIYLEKSCPELKTTADALKGLQAY
jgi:hypothetical protein